MANDGSIDHHRPVNWVETEADTQAAGQFRAVWTDGGRTVKVTGPCPGCGGTTVTDFSAGIAGSKGFRDSGRSGPYLLPAEITLFCECGHVHADRPSDAIDRGCGRFWLVSIPEDVRRPPAGNAKS